VLIIGGKAKPGAPVRTCGSFPRHPGQSRDALQGEQRHNWRWSRSQFPKPTIARCMAMFGGAFTQLCAVDFAIAAEDATFGLSEVNWGIIPAAS
jgi:trans-feruloyl-CoA hydratase/vanillin synthase